MLSVITTEVKRKFCPGQSGHLHLSRTKPHPLVHDKRYDSWQGERVKPRIQGPPHRQRFDTPSQSIGQ